MARARNIKPSIFKNELLGVADPLITILFISLWTLADKQGRLEDRPLRIRGETFPYRENLDVNGYLTELVSLGFIVRYEVDGVKIIEVVNFTKHQTPHSTEKQSVLPANPIGKPVTVILPLNNESASVISHINVLTPDLLIPDLLIPEKIHTHLSMLLNVGVEKQIAMNAGIKICVEQGWAGFSADWLSSVPELKVSGPFVHWFDTEEATYERARKEGVSTEGVDLGTLRVRVNDVIQSKKQQRA